MRRNFCEKKKKKVNKLIQYTPWDEHETVLTIN